MITKFWGETRYWWALLLAGILLVVGGFAYWFWPAAGYAVSSVLFGWLLIAAGIVQLCVSSGANRPKGWGWWLAGGVIDIFVGFLMVRSVVVSEMLMPYFLAFIFVYWGVSALVSFAYHTGRRRWLSLINGILMVIIGCLFVEGGYLSDMMMVSFITAIAFIYWGFTLALVSYDMRPVNVTDKQN